MSHRLFRATSIVSSGSFWVGASALCATLLLSNPTTYAQDRSRLEDVTGRSTTTQRSSRARVPDARLYDDMTVIQRDRSSHTPTTSTSKAPAPQEAQPPRSASAPTRTPAASPTSTDTSTATQTASTKERAHTPAQQSTPSPERNAATDNGGGTLFASATIRRDEDAPKRRSSAPSSQAYVPMLPEDFYASTNVRVDPVASEVGVADMEPADSESGGFRYLERRPLEVSNARRGIVQPYPLTNVFSTFGDCRPGGRTHSGLDIGGVGSDGGIGTPIYSMSRAKVTYIGRPEDDPDKFGQPDRGKGTTQRGPRSMQLPRSKEVPGYGIVNFFTRTYGSWRTGTILVMEGVEGPLKGHRIRYMHLGAVHPELHVGDIIEGGQEVGLMGGTAILHDMPHVHIDIENAKGQRVDVAPYIGLPGDNSRCR